MPRTSLKFGKRLAGRMGHSLCCLLVLVPAAVAQPSPPAPRFTGTSIPDPPRQHEPWAPPDTELPRFLVTATAALFAAGMADPRGCAYRDIEVRDTSLIKTRGFVRPETPGEAGRFAVDWDGVVYPVSSVGAPADLEADVRSVTEAMKRARRESDTPGARRSGLSAGFQASNRQGYWSFDPSGPTAVDNRSSLKLCVLLRLDRADLAEQLFAAATPWTSEVPRGDLTDYHISFLTLANEWAGAVFDRLVSAHVRGEDVVALDAARRLAAFQKAVDARAAAMGFERPEGRAAAPGPSSYVGSLDRLPAFLADHERRAQEPPRGPIPARGGDASGRIAALIRDFDQIHVVQSSNPGSADPGSAPIVQQVIAEGDLAVELLLAALVSDTRLTRSASGLRRPAYVHPVTDAVYRALVGVLKTNRFLEDGDEYTARTTPEGRKRLAAAMRAFWVQNRAITLEERWYRALRDDSAGTDRWLEAAAGIVQPAGENGPPYTGRVYALNPLKAGEVPALKGDPLRSRHGPSVSELMARRVMDILRTANPLPNPDIGLIRACELAMAFARWDESAALPTLKLLTETCRERSRGGQANDQSNRSYGHQIAGFTLIRNRAGDRAALDEYAAWVKGIRPESIERELVEILEPIWTYPVHPAIAAAARTMFVDPNSPWLPLVPREKGRQRVLPEIPINSPLVCIPEFREALLAALADRSSAGTAKRLERRGIEYSLVSGTRGSAGGAGMRVAEPDDRVNVEVAFRACDYIAWQLSTLPAAPECQLYWTEARRDTAVAACRDYLLKYGRNLSTEGLPGKHDFPHTRAHLRFPAQDHPATADDVRAARAIFSLAGDGEARLAAMPTSFPIRARWLALRTDPIDRPRGNDRPRPEHLQGGWVWQAEEVRQGDRWERFYGFVGHATIARALASEVEFPPDDFGWRSLPDGLDARLELSSPVDGGIPPGRPVSVTLKIRNRRGVERPVPTEFLRPADDGKPALRRGLTLALFSVAQENTGSPVSALAQNGEHEPTRAAHFDPGVALRTLAPTESFGAMQIELSDWFGPLAPGAYRVRIAFSKNSGLGEEPTNDLYFMIGDQGERSR
jgi:hypothetical protein